MTPKSVDTSSQEDNDFMFAVTLDIKMNTTASGLRKNMYLLKEHSV